MNASLMKIVEAVKIVSMDIALIYAEKTPIVGHQIYVKCVYLQQLVQLRQTVNSVIIYSNIMYSIFKLSF